MESFSLLKYWRGGGGGAAAIAATFRTSNPASTPASTIVRPSSAAIEDGEDKDDGPFFDLVFSTLPVDACAEEGGLRPEGLFTSDDLFFQGKLVPLEPASLVVAAAASEYTKPQLAAVSLLESATRLRVFLLGLRKRKLAAAPEQAGSPKRPPQPHQRRSFVRFKVEDVPIVSLFARDSAKAPAEGSALADAAEETGLAGELVHRYLRVIKPLYVRASRRYDEKLRLHGGATPGREEVTACGVVGAGKRPREVGRRRPATGLIDELPSPPPQRRDDTLREQQDGIQSAIAHCKRSLAGKGRTGEAPAHNVRDPAAAGVL